MDGNLFYSSTYIENLSYQKLVQHDVAGINSVFEIAEHNAVSLTRAPYGGFHIVSRHFNLNAHLISLKKSLQQKGIKSITIHQPGDFHPDFIQNDELLKLGFSAITNNIKQVINLESFEFHQMEKRILKRKTEFKIERTDDFLMVHEFISKCRAHQGLQINISLDNLLQLKTKLPISYEAFVVRFSKEVAAACIFVKQSKSVVYYYLPATHTDFKSQSPMVHLLNKAVKDYRNEGLKWMDLGKSSVNGSKQESLFTFKERMGATAYPQLTLRLEI